MINREIEATVVSSSWSVTSSPGGGPQQAWLGLHSARAFLSANGISASVRKLIFKSALSHSLERKAVMVGAKWGEKEKKGGRKKNLLKCQCEKKLNACAYTCTSPFFSAEPCITVYTHLIEFKVLIRH